MIAEDFACERNGVWTTFLTEFVPQPDFVHRLRCSSDRA